jgi:hypothetical protein
MRSDGAARAGPPAAGVTGPLGAPRRMPYLHRIRHRPRVTPGRDHRVDAASRRALHAAGRSNPDGSRMMGRCAPIACCSATATGMVRVGAPVPPRRGASRGADTIAGAQCECLCGAVRAVDQKRSASIGSFRWASGAFERPSRNSLPTVTTSEIISKGPTIDSAKAGPSLDARAAFVGLRALPWTPRPRQGAVLPTPHSSCLRDGAFDQMATIPGAFGTAIDATSPFRALSPLKATRRLRHEWPRL